MNRPYVRAASNLILFHVNADEIGDNFQTSVLLMTALFLMWNLRLRGSVST